jgi:hypothetical protein
MRLIITLDGLRDDLLFWCRALEGWVECDGHELRGVKADDYVRKARYQNV